MNEPPDQTAELSAENLLSAGGMTVREILAHDVLVLAQAGVHVGEQHALRFEILADAMVDHFGIVLRGDAAQKLALGFGDAQAIERALDIRGHFFPRLAFDVGCAHIIVDVREIDLIRAPRGPPTAAAAWRRKMSSERWRKSRIHCGSFFICEICSTISWSMPLRDLNAYLSRLVAKSVLIVFIDELSACLSAICILRLHQVFDERIVARCASSSCASSGPPSLTILPLHEDVHSVRLHVVENALVMRDEQNRALGSRAELRCLRR